jgi:hypothetical protein
MRFCCNSENRRIIKQHTTVDGREEAYITAGYPLQRPNAPFRQISTLRLRSFLKMAQGRKSREFETANSKKKSARVSLFQNPASLHQKEFRLTFENEFDTKI